MSHKNLSSVTVLKIQPRQNSPTNADISQNPHAIKKANETILINFSTTTGFPQLQIALVSDHGYIEAFPIDGLAYETFPKLQFKRYDPFASSTISGTNNNGLSVSCFL